MKTSFCTNVFKPEELEERIADLSKLGYDGVEFWQQHLDGADREKVKKMLEDNNISASQLCPYFDFTDTEEKRLESIELGKKYAELAGYLNCPNIRVFTGKLSSKDASLELWRHAALSLRKLCDIAPEINFVLETHPGSLMDTSESTLRLLSMTDRENLKVNLQVPLVDGEDVFESAKKLGKHTCHLHAHNWKLKEGGNWGGVGELTFLSEGDYDFKEFVSVLKSEGFDGYISIEHPTHRGEHSPLETAGKEIGYLKKVIKELG
jgi:3-dehydroshikimate dehydratase